MSLTSTVDDTKITLEKMKEATLRADEIIRGLLTFSRPSELKIETINPESFINDILSLIQYRRKLRAIEIHTAFPQEPLAIDVDKNQMQQVIFNILMNAVESMPEGGVITISVSLETTRKELVDEEVCVLSISDEGQGITAENLPRLFEPFFTTKRNKGGTGLGLSIAKMIVENHKGTLQIKSTPGKGTTVSVALPLAAGSRPS
jgi:signal transduction histidine kinase